MAVRNVTLCDFCEKQVAVHQCCVCSQDGCEACLGYQATLALVTSAGKSLAGVVSYDLRPGNTIQKDPHVRVTEEHKGPLCEKCHSDFREFVRGELADKILQEGFTSLMGRAKAAWAVKAMTGKNINEGDDNDEDDGALPFPGAGR